MSINNISAELNESWNELSSSWSGEGAKSYQAAYVQKLSEIVTDFERACNNLIEQSQELSAQMLELERTTDN